MSPEFGSTCAIFPIDDETLDYLRLTGRPAQQVALVEAYAKEQGLWHDPGQPARYSEELDARPVHRGARRWPARSARRTGWRWPTPRPRSATRCGAYVRRPGWTTGSPGTFPASDPVAAQRPGDPRRPTPAPGHPGRRHDRRRSTTAPSSSPRSRPAPTPRTRRSWSAPRCWPRRRSRRGLARKPWVKTTLAPGSKVVMDYYERAGLMPVPGEARLQPGRLRLHHLHRQLRAAARGDQRGGRRERPRRGVGAVGQPELRGPDQPGREDELPGLAAAGGRLRAGRDDGHRPGDASRSGTGADGKPVYLRDIWPCPAEVADGRAGRGRGGDVHPRLRRRVRGRRPVAGAATCPTGDTFAWDAGSTYVRRPPYFDGDAGRARRRSPTSTAPGCWPCSATR